MNSYKSALDSAAVSAANLAKYAGGTSVSIPSANTSNDSSTTTSISNKLDPNKWYVLDKNRLIIASFSTQKAADNFATKNGYNNIAAGSALLASGYYKTHHKGLDAGFVGNIKGNEEFVKALKGEVFVTKQQQDKFMSSILPDIVSSSMKTIGSSMSFGNLLNITVQGNLDSSVVPKIEEIVKKSVQNLNKTMLKTGFVRGTNTVSI